MELNKLDASVLESFPKPDEAAIEKELREALAQYKKKIVVLDDDPTGIQTLHGVSVYTSWDEAAIRAGFLEENGMFFLLTNSRSFTEEQVARVSEEIGGTLCRVSMETGIDYVVVSRSDSTLRGHFFLETETLRRSIESHSSKRFDGEIFMPFFKEGGRFTIGDVQYVLEGDTLTPSGQTEFAKDKTFGYGSSHLGEYVEEKTAGAFKKDSCIFISLDELRGNDVAGITAKLMGADGFRKVIVNAVDYRDVKVFVTAFVQAALAGAAFIFRTAASLPRVLGGVPDQPLLTRAQLLNPENQNGGLVVIGSHVNKTTKQLEALKQSNAPLELIEFNQHLVVNPKLLEDEVDRVVKLAEVAVSKGKCAVVYTRRERLDLPDMDGGAQLEISVRISDAVTDIVRRMKARPGFIIAKGGITSSDIGVKALKVKKALAMGQIAPGIPVWRLGPEALFPGMSYVIFPGNVGGEETLREMVEGLTKNN